MDKRELITINGLPLAKEPSGYAAASSTMADEGMSVSGKMLGSVVREDVAQVSLSWPYLTAGEWAEINGLFKADGSGSRFSNEVEFFDQTIGGWRKCLMRVSDRSAGMSRYGKDGAVEGWFDCALSLSEV